MASLYIKKLLPLLLIFSLQNELHAQLGKRILNRAKNTAEHKVNSKVDKTVDKGISEIDTLLSGKKTKSTEKETTKPPVESPAPKPKNENTPVGTNQPIENTEPTPLPTANEFARQMNTEWITDIIFTNIKCDKGKRSVEKKLSATKGVRSVQVNIQSGELTIAYFNSGLNYEEIVAIINQLNFDADEKKAAADKNGCQ